MTKAFLWMIKMINDIARKAAEYWHHVEQAEIAMRQLRKMVLAAGKDAAKLTPEERKQIRDNKKAGVDQMVEAGLRWTGFKQQGAKLGLMSPEQIAEHLAMTKPTKQELGYIRRSTLNRNMKIEVEQDGGKRLMVPVCGVRENLWVKYRSCD